MGSKPRPIQIVTLSKADHSFNLETEALAQILLAPEIRDKQVMVLSVAGAVRKGKSFLLNFMIRYLYRKDDENWLGLDDEYLTGFSWRGGSEPETTGIQLWSEVFIVQKQDGTEVAVVLMDTQGAFDDQSTVKDCATIFALSTLISSVQIYNVSENIRKTDLQPLHLFTEYGCIAMDEIVGKPFQSLMLLVRDWSFAYEYTYGLKGGKQFLDKCLQATQHEELQTIRKHIHSCFSDISCFLLPHPGMKVAISSTFEGQLCDVASEFKEQLKILIPELLHPDRLVEKKINGNKVTCMGLFEFFKAYIKIYQGGDLPQPKTVFMATAEANNLAAVATAKEQYYRNMEKVCGGNLPYMDPTSLEKKHQFFSKEALDTFSSTKKMGGQEFCDNYQAQLEEELEEMWQFFYKQNMSKSLSSTFQTPSVLFVLICLFYILSGVFHFVGLATLALVCDFTLGVLMMATLTWAFTRYSGHYQNVGEAIDKVAGVTLEQANEALNEWMGPTTIQHKKSS